VQGYCPENAPEKLEILAPGAAAGDPALLAGIDLGINNLATIASNKVGFVPVIVNGRPLKAINQFYNKRRAALQAYS
jgi:putative transposase